MGVRRRLGLKGRVAAAFIVAASTCFTPGQTILTSSKVLKNHRVKYSDPIIDADYTSDQNFNARGMQHVYTITHTFLDLIQREKVLPDSINGSALLDGPGPKRAAILSEHWEELLLQYVGVATLAVCGILMAVAIPVAGICTCFCRCAGKCGAYPEHFDKRGDACKRWALGAVMAALVIAATFGVVSAFVTNHYAYQGLDRLPGRLSAASDDAAKFLGNTGSQVSSLLVANFVELENVLNRVLEDSGPILKQSLAQVTQAVAIDNLADIVSGLGKVKSHLRKIQNKTLLLQDKVGQLRLGLTGSKERLLAALEQCSANKICVEFMQTYDIGRDLSVATDFERLPLELPDVGLLLRDIGDLVNNDIENKVRLGQRQLDKVKLDIEASMGSLRPTIKQEIRKMGRELERTSDDATAVLEQAASRLGVVDADVVPALDGGRAFASGYAYYVGLGMACLVLLVLSCHVLGLFYGFFGKRPGNVYGDDCCNRGSGANWLLAGVYLTFMFSLVLLSLTTAIFVVGSTADKVVCRSLAEPGRSELVRLADDKYVQPFLARQNLRPDATLVELVGKCHRNETLYEVLNLRTVFDVEGLRNWRETYGIGDYIGSLKDKIRLDDDLRDIQILSPQAERDLRELSESQLSDLNATQYTRLLEEKIVLLELDTFIQKLRQVKQRLGRTQGRIVGPAIENEILFLRQMQEVVVQMQLGMNQLQASVQQLENDAKFNKVSMREALQGLLRQAKDASRFLRNEGPQLVEMLANNYVNETTGLIDDYVGRVINRTRNHVGNCEPVSAAYNATVVAVCNEIVDPFNGFWASVGWCYLFFLPCISLAISLVTLYRKSEPYPGPLVEVQQEDVGPARSGHKKKKRRGHRRNASEYLPDSAHYRAGYSYQDRDNRFRDAAPRNFDGPASAAGGGQPAGGPPRYTSNPNLAADVNPEYERPPPYYYPGAPPADAPPPLPAPNCRP